MAVAAWFENDGLFRQELAGGYAWQQWVARFLTLRGLRVELPELIVRDDVRTKGTDYVDSVDLHVEGQRIEVKSRREWFSTPTDYPFKTAFVDTRTKFELHAGAVRAYIIVSRLSGAMLVVSCATSAQWVPQARRDSVRGIDEVFLGCPRPLLRSIDWLVEKLRAQGARRGNRGQEQLEAEAQHLRKKLKAEAAE
jgi:hypothetical protein